MWKWGLIIVPIGTAISLWLSQKEINSKKPLLGLQRMQEKGEYEKLIIKCRQYLSSPAYNKSMKKYVGTFMCVQLAEIGDERFMEGLPYIKKKERDFILLSYYYNAYRFDELTHLIDKMIASGEEKQIANAYYYKGWLHATLFENEKQTQAYLDGARACKGKRRDNLASFAYETAMRDFDTERANQAYALMSKKKGENCIFLREKFESSMRKAKKENIDHTWFTKLNARLKEYARPALWLDLKTAVQADIKNKDVPFTNYCGGVKVYDHESLKKNIWQFIMQIDFSTLPAPFTKPYALRFWFVGRDSGVRCEDGVLPCNYIDLLSENEEENIADIKNGAIATVIRCNPKPCAFQKDEKFEKNFSSTIREVTFFQISETPGAFTATGLKVCEQEGMTPAEKVLEATGENLLKAVGMNKDNKIGGYPLMFKNLAGQDKDNDFCLLQWGQKMNHDGRRVFSICMKWADFLADDFSKACVLRQNSFLDKKNY